MNGGEKKIVVLGDSGVGKTALVQRFVRGTFVNDYRPTSGAVPHKKKVEAGGKTVSLVIWDVAGHTLKLHPAYTAGADGAILVCDLSRQISFDSVLQWHQVIRDKMGDIPVIVAGNKSDLAGPDNCEALHKAGYSGYRTSAMTGENVEALFMELICAIG
ncbi:MAG: GTP-binding protein [Thermoplasmata archaeon]|nr:GTP-binding protein [Thermoplasmata archaeon]